MSQVAEEPQAAEGSAEVAAGGEEAAQVDDLKRDMIRTESNCSCGALAAQEECTGPDILAEEDSSKRNNIPDVIGDLPPHEEGCTAINPDITTTIRGISLYEGQKAGGLDSAPSSAPPVIFTAGDKPSSESLTPHMQPSNNQYFTYEDTSNKDTSGEQEAAASEQGILKRTIGSLSSLGSTISSNSPNFSTFVDFSSGLFTRGQEDKEAVRDISEATPPPSASQKDSSSRTTWFVDDKIIEPSTHSDKSNKPRRWSNNSDISVENVVKLGDKPELFQSLDGKCCYSTGMYKVWLLLHE